ncbi:MAG: aminomethyl-transferring glycine dehydrogenase subunit GcvPA [Planctomycetota bacterium]
MAYLFNTPEEQQAMLAAIGAKSIDELFATIPEAMRLRRPLNLPEALGELPLTQSLTRLASENQSTQQLVCFLGAGAYDHFIPAVVDAIASRSEFYTSYTPYQPEVSQGNLQVMFEYQTLVCQLTGLDVANASLYDGASAAAEAVLLCMSATERPKRVVTAASVHPEYRAVIRTYFANLGAELVEVATPTGRVSPSDLARAVDRNTACVLLQQPNFFGAIEELETLADVAHNAGAMMAVAFDPLSVGLLKRPGDCGADVAIAEGQSLGSPLQFGGPYLGLMACREPFVRRLPGRIAGQTVDRDGRRCWVLTLQTREQHIRRDKATSNICTNQGLMALRAAVYLAAMGRQGFQETARLCLWKAAYARSRLANSQRYEVCFQLPTFKEFLVRDKRGDVASALAAARREGILAGVPVGRWYPEFADCFLVAVTEQRTREEIDRWSEALERA